MGPSADLVEIFREEAESRILTIRNLLKLWGDDLALNYQSVNEIFREIHVIKGGASFFQDRRLVLLTHELEDLLDRIRKNLLPSDLLVAEQIEAHLAEILSCLRFPMRSIEEENFEEPLPEAISLRVPQAFLALEQDIEYLIQNLGEPADHHFDEQLQIIEELKQFSGADHSRVLPLLDGLRNCFLYLSTQQNPIDSGQLDQAKRVCHILGQQYAGLQDYNEDELAKLADHFSEYFPMSSHPSPLNVTPDDLGKSSILPEVMVELEKIKGELEAVTSAQLARLDQVEPQLQGSIQQLHAIQIKMSLQMERLHWVPLQPKVNHLEFMAQDIALTLGKQLVLQLECGVIYLPKGVAKNIIDILIQLVRNACTHGIETTQERLGLGKAAQGKLLILIQQQGQQIYLQVKDDGQGLDLQKISQKAQEAGIYQSADLDHITPEELQWVIFQPDFSTQSKVDSFAGRGVGLDMVKEMVDALQGDLNLQHTAGQGLTIEIDFPL